MQGLLPFGHFCYKASHASAHTSAHTSAIDCMIWLIVSMLGAVVEGCCLIPLRAPPGLKCREVVSVSGQNESLSDMNEQGVLVER